MKRDSQNCSRAKSQKTKADVIIIILPAYFSHRRRSAWHQHCLIQEMNLKFNADCLTFYRSSKHTTRWYVKTTRITSTFSKTPQWRNLWCRYNMYLKSRFPLHRSASVLLVHTENMGHGFHTCVMEHFPPVSASVLPHLHVCSFHCQTMNHTRDTDLLTTTHCPVLLSILFRLHCILIT